MTLEEYKNIVTESVTTEDREGTAKKLLEAITEDVTKLNANEAVIDTLQKQVTDLQAENKRLTLSQTGEAPKEEEEKETTPRDEFNKLFDERFYGGKE